MKMKIMYHSLKLVKKYNFALYERTLFSYEFILYIILYLNKYYKISSLLEV